MHPDATKFLEADVKELLLERPALLSFIVSFSKYGKAKRDSKMLMSTALRVMRLILAPIVWLQGRPLKALDHLNMVSYTLPLSWKDEAFEQDFDDLVRRVGHSQYFCRHRGVNVFGHLEFDFQHVNGKGRFARQDELPGSETELAITTQEIRR